MKMSWLLGLLVFLFTATTAFAQTPKCDALTGNAKTVAQGVLDTASPYACCDDTISACLKSAQPCKLAIRLADEVCRFAAAGKNAQDIRHILDQRSMAMTDLMPAAKIEMRPEHVWGNPQSKVVLSVYVCGRCPFCSRHIPALIHALEQSDIKDKVAINLRLFPIKSHDNSTPAALAIEAAAQMGKAWPYLLKEYENFDSFSLASLPVWAKELELEEAKFSELSKDPKIRDLVVASKKEGLTNKVDSTPTLFLNGHKIQGSFDVESIMSMLGEALESE